MTSEQPARMDATGEPVTDREAHGAVPAEPQQSLRDEVVTREQNEFGGMKFGSAFFGWLTATGTAVLLTALVAATGAAVGLGTNTTASEAANAAGSNSGTVGVIGVIAVLLILLVAYFSGGYVAGRMARFSGAKQGIAVWIWAIVIAIVVAIIGALAGGQFNILANVNSFPRIPINEGTLTVASVVTVVGAIVLSLVGAILGGLAGMRYHRKIDRVGLGR
ncbi:MAG: hypothetical protein JWR53_313 [Glaciihabitans sp.]|nr:hypothetical protein [Glaciihabitans sp.]